MRRPAPVPALLLALALALGLAGAGCASSDDDASDSAGDGGAAEVAPGGERADGADAATDATTAEGAPGEGVAAQAVDVEADRIVEPADAARDAIALAEAAGGSLSGQSEVDGEDEVTVTVRVPVAEFRPTLDAMADLGVVLDRRVDAADVTDQVVDLEGRLENARASADRLRALYAEAQGVEQIVSIEQALTQREEEVETLAGQLQQLEDRADRSTITVRYVDEGEPVVDDEPPPDDDHPFVDGLRAGGRVLAAVGTALAALAGFALPFLPFVLVPALVVLVVARVRRRRAGHVGSDPT
jgi:hypothetical protein